MHSRTDDRFAPYMEQTRPLLSVLWLGLIVVSLSACFPYARTAEDASGFRDNIVDNAIKSVPLLAQTQRNKNEIYGTRILTAFLNKFPAGSDATEAVAYLSSVGSQCAEDRAESTIQVRCRYEKQWPFTVYEMWGPFQMFRGDVLRQGEVNLQVTLSISSSKKKIEKVTASAIHSSTKPLSPWRLENE